MKDKIGELVQKGCLNEFSEKLTITVAVIEEEVEVVMEAGLEVDILEVLGVQWPIPWTRG